MDILSLVLEARSGSQSARNELYRILYLFAERIFSHYRLPQEDVEDLTHTCIEKLYVSLKNFRGYTEAEFFSYYKSICQNTLKNFFRSARNRSEVPGEDINSEREELSDILEEFERKDTLHRILKDLNLREREILLLKVRGYDEKEISKMLGIPAGTVSSSFSRTLKKLKEKSSE